MKRKILSTIALATLCCGLSYGQATIGSETPPRKGALLDLQENADGTSKKGLGLPRVKLLETRIPDGKSLAQTIDGTASDANWDKDEHIGLVIYNTNTDPSGCQYYGDMTDRKYVDTPMVGVYVWTGKTWERVPGIKDAEDVRTIVDHGIVGPVGTFTMSYTDEDNNTENETYYYASFGDAGTWMTQNMRTKYAPDGTKIEMTGKQPYKGILPQSQPYAYRACAGYPNKDYQDGSDPTLYNKNVAAGKQVGLLYDWYTTTDNRNCHLRNQKQVGFLDDNPPTIGEYEVENWARDGYIKGICPKGWHVPSYREWSALEKELTISADKYTQTPIAGTAWDKLWETADFPEKRSKTSNIAFKSTTAVEDGTSYSYCDSKTAENGGFDVLFVGNIGIGNGEGRTANYSFGADFWMSSMGTSTVGNSNSHAYLMEFTRYSDRTQTLPFNPWIFMSVRCKKNEK